MGYKKELAEIIKNLAEKLNVSINSQAEIDKIVSKLEIINKYLPESEYSLLPNIIVLVLELKANDLLSNLNESFFKLVNSVYLFQFQLKARIRFLDVMELLIKPHQLIGEKYNETADKIYEFRNFEILFHILSHKFRKDPNEEDEKLLKLHNESLFELVLLCNKYFNLLITDCSKNESVLVNKFIGALYKNLCSIFYFNQEEYSLENLEKLLEHISKNKQYYINYCYKEGIGINPKTLTETVKQIKGFKYMLDVANTEIKEGGSYE